MVASWEPPLGREDSLTLCFLVLKDYHHLSDAEQAIVLSLADGISQHYLALMVRGRRTNPTADYGSQPPKVLCYETVDTILKNEDNMKHR